MENKLLFQLQDSFRATALTSHETSELALQVLVWAKLSAAGAIPQELSLGSTFVSESPDRAMSALSQLANEPGIVGQAFSDGKFLHRLDPVALRRALDLALRASETGVLANLEATDAIFALSLPAGGESSLPPEVANLLIALAQIDRKETVYVPWDWGGQLASRAARLAADVYLESPRRSVIPALISLLGEHRFYVEYADPVAAPSAVEGGRLRQFDVAIAFPPLGQRYDLDMVDHDWFGRFPERTPQGTVLAIRHLLSQARRRVVVAVANNLLFSNGVELVLRKELIQRGVVEAVIAMPAGLLPDTGIPFSVLVLDPAGSRDRVKFLNADAPRFREGISRTKSRLTNLDTFVALFDGKGESEDVALASIDHVLENDAQLQVSRYVLPDTAKALHARLASSPTVVLGDVVTATKLMARLAPNRAGDSDSIEVFEVGAADLPDHGYIDAPGRVVRIESQVTEKSEQQFLRPFDIVLIVKGSVGKVGIVPPDAPPPGPGGWVAGQSAVALRLTRGSHIDARALFVQLRSSLGQKLLAGIVSGASIQLIQLRELMRLQVLMPDQEVEQRAINALDQEAKLQREIDHLREQQAQIAADIWAFA